MDKIKGRPMSSTKTFPGKIIAKDNLWNHTFHFYFKAFNTFAIVSIVYYVGVTIIAQLPVVIMYGTLLADPSDYYPGSVLFLLMFLHVIYNIYLMLLVRCIDLNETIRYKDLFRTAIKKVPGVLALILLLALIYLTLSLLSGLSFSILMFPLVLTLSKSTYTAGAVVIGFVELILFLVAMTILLVHLSLSFPVVVLEETNAIHSIKRSWNLIRGGAWQVFGNGLVVCLIISLALIISRGLIAVSRHLIGEGTFTTFISLTSPFISTIVLPLISIILYKIYQWRNSEGTLSSNKIAR